MGGIHKKSKMACRVNGLLMANYGFYAWGPKAYAWLGRIINLWNFKLNPERSTDKFSKGENGWLERCIRRTLGGMRLPTSCSYWIQAFFKPCHIKQNEPWKACRHFLSREKILEDRWRSRGLGGDVPCWSCQGTRQRYGPRHWPCSWPCRHLRL